MGFTTQEALKLTFKVQAGGVIDAASGNQWYESIFPFNPSINANRVLTQFDQVKLYPAGNGASASSASLAIPSIIQNRSSSGTFSSLRLTQVTAGDNSTWVAYENYNDRSSTVLDLWIQPQKVPQPSGDPSIGYSVRLYSGAPITGGVEITTTIGQSGGEVGWVFNYDMGMLFIANDLVTLISNNPGTYPAGLDFYINGFRYIGKTLVDENSGGSVSFEDSQTISFTKTGNTYSAYVIDGSLTASQLNTGFNGGPTAGYSLSVDDDGNFAWVNPVSGSGSSLSVSDYITGITYSNVQNIIFRGGAVSVPNPIGGTATGVLATGTTPTVTVWVPAPPQAVYASHFTTTDGNTNGLASRSLSISSVRISSPTSEGVPFETNGWAGQVQAATTNSTPNIYSGGLVTGFSESPTGDSTITVRVYRADGVTLFDTYTTPTIYQNGTHNSGTGISVAISAYSIDDSGFPEIYTAKWKAFIGVSVNMDTIFGSYSLDGGRYKIRVDHFTDTLTDGGVTYSFVANDVFYDTNLSTPSISGTTTIVESTNTSNIITNHISGVEYYTTGSQFEITTTGIDNLNQNTQGFSGGVIKNFTITAPNYNLQPYSLQAWAPLVGTFQGWSNIYTLTGVTFSYTSWSISPSTTYRYRGSNAKATSQDFDPWGSSATSNSSTSSILIDQFPDNSSRLGESFNGESERLLRGSSSYSSWDSTTFLQTSISNQTGTGPFCDACIVGGRLVRPDNYFLTDPNTNTLQPNLSLFKPNKGGSNPDYTSYTQICTYHRKFYTTSALNISSFLMAFSGSFGSSGNATTALVNSQLKVYIRRVDCVTGGSFGFNANPLSLHGGLYDSGAPSNPFNDGASGVDTPGSLIRTGSSSGNNVTATFGTFAAKTGFWVEVQIVDPSIKIDTINVTLTFSNNSTDSAPVT